MSTPLLLKGSTILVTGVNGFIASHVAGQLLEDHYNVRGTVRVASKGKALQNHFDGKYGAGRFEVVVVDDISREGAIDGALKDVDGVVHVATGAIFTTDLDLAIRQAIAGALGILRSAARHSSIKSFVYTLDSWAIAFPEPSREPKLCPSTTLETITSSTLNEWALITGHDSAALADHKAHAWDPDNAVQLVIWAAAKVAAERATLSFIKESKPSFQVSAVVPSFCIGAPVGPMQHSSTGTTIPNLLLSRPADMFFPAQHFVNVQDCAKLHVAALLDPSQNGERLFACAEAFNWNDILLILRRLRPYADVRADFQNLGTDISVMPSGSAEQLLKKWYGHGWTALEETVGQNIEGL